jgi:hypothetical protein
MTPERRTEGERAVRRVQVPAAGLPIPVERWEGDQITLLACEKCGAARQAVPDEIGLSDGLGACPESCGGWLWWAYMEADKCGGCGALGWFDDALKHCCSRACMLQVEYAQTLGGAA